MQLYIPTISITSDVLDFLGDEDPWKKSRKKAIKKRMITVVFMILPFYLIWFFIRWRFRRVIKAMADVGNILNDDDLFGDTVDTLKEGIGQHEKRECLKGAISKGKAYLLVSKWTEEKVEKASDDIINRKYA